MRYELSSNDKRYQVFISSTYSDLISERREVIQALLELDCIPSGMELFQAANEDQWTTIKGVIDDCDYYIVIIGGRYGSIGPNEISYTEMEYRYALEAKKPIIAFLHKEPGKISVEKSEKNPELAEKLNKFRELAQKKMVRYWTNAEDLGSMVSRSMIRLMKNNPAIGWVRANSIVDTESFKQINKLQQKISELESELNRIRTTAPIGSEQFAQGDSIFQINVDGKYKEASYTSGYYESKDIIEVKWSELFSVLAPHMIDEATDHHLKSTLVSFIEGLYGSDKFPTKKARNDLERLVELKIKNLNISDDDFQTIKIQLRALGLIEKSSRNRSVKDNQTYWTLTPFGDQEMTKIRAIKVDR